MDRRVFLTLSGGAFLIWLPPAWSADQPIGYLYGVSDGGVQMRLLYDRATKFWGTINPGPTDSTHNLPFTSDPRYVNEQGKVEADNGVASVKLDSNNDSNLRIRVLFTDRKGGDAIFSKAGDVITGYKPPGKDEHTWWHVGNIIDQGTT